MGTSEQATGFDEFALAELRRLLALATALTGNPHDAWDLTQEALARTGERWPKVETNPAAYARTIMVRLNIDRLRRLRRELPMLKPAQEEAATIHLQGIDQWLVDGLA